MSQRKHCSYKGCKSKQTPGITSDITFFQFPREDSRYDLWMALSRCENKDSAPKYLCSKHFDERKYISRNPRRLLLLASAVPYEYVSDNEDNETDNEVDITDADEQIQIVTSKSDDEEFLMQNVDENDFAPEADCSYAESTSNDVGYIKVEAPSNSFEILNKKRKWFSDQESLSTVKVIPTEEIPSPTYQLEINEISTSKSDVHEHSSRTTAKEKSPPPAPAKKIRQQSQYQDEEYDDDAIIDNPNITTFIFRGEEYIQMPRRIYIKEKQEIMRKLHLYKENVINIKEQIDNLIKSTESH